MGRQWGVFVIKVPKDFGDKVIRWTIVANGETQTVPFSLNKGYPITPFKELGMGNQPPTLWFGEGGAKVTGPPVGIAGSFSGVVNQPVAITVFAEDVKEKDSKAVNVATRLVAQASRSRQRHVRARALAGAARPARRSRCRRRSRRRASTCCACKPTMNRVKAAADFSVAGPIHTSK